MNWKFWKKETEPKDKTEPEKIDGWRLTITEKDGFGMTYSNPEMKPLWKIYKWYLTKDSDKYNIEFNNGMRILHRHNVVSMELQKEKINDIWSNNDETETE